MLTPATRAVFASDIAATRTGYPAAVVDQVIASRVDVHRRYEANFDAAMRALERTRPDRRASLLRRLDRLDKLHCRSGTAAYSASADLLRAGGFGCALGLFQHDREELVRCFGGAVTGDRIAA